MPLGKGRYDAECTAARESAKAKCALLLLIDGDRGTGFSCQADIATLEVLPAILRDIANQIEQTMKGTET